MTDCATCTTCEGGSYDLCLVQWQDWVQTFAVLLNGEPQDLTGLEIALYAQSPDGADNVSVSTLDGGIVIGAPPLENTFTVSILEAMTKGMAAGSWSYEIWVAGSRLICGTLAVIASIRQDTP